MFESKSSFDNFIIPFLSSLIEASTTIRVSRPTHAIFMDWQVFELFLEVLRNLRYFPGLKNLHETLEPFEWRKHSIEKQIVNV